MRTTLRLALGCILVVAAAPLLADDLTGAQTILCSSTQATLCTPDGDCSTDPPWVLNIPQFVEIDLQARRISTTEASGQNRSTGIKHMQREGGMIVLQGYENGRAFSFAIGEQSGMATIAVARDGGGVIVFGSCTPKS